MLQSIQIDLISEDYNEVVIIHSFSMLYHILIYKIICRYGRQGRGV